MLFKHKIVNDLAWVIGSVPIMSFNPKSESYCQLNQRWFDDEFERCNDFLWRLDASPASLENFVNVEGKQLLGKRFERFVEYWLRYGGRFEVLMANEQLKNGKVTIGEVDYLIRETLTGQILHLEVASKYYLGYNNSSLWSNWIGLNASDTLADKMAKFERQLNIFQSKEGMELLHHERIKSPKSFLMMKGFFFYYWRNVMNAKSPKFSTKNHHTGVHLREGEIGDFFTSVKLSLL